MNDDQDKPPTDEDVSQENIPQEDTPADDAKEPQEPEIDLSAWGITAESLDDGHQVTIEHKQDFTEIINRGLSHYERLPMLEIVFDRLVRLLSGSLRNFTFEVVEVKLDAIKSIRFSEYLKHVPSPSLFSIFTSREWGNHGLILMDNDLIYVMIDILLGGRKGIAPIRTDDRTFTTIECNLLSRLTNIILYDLKGAFLPITTVTFEQDRVETNPLFASITKPSNAVIIARFQIEIDVKTGFFEIAIPYAMLEPIRDVLLKNFTGEQAGDENLWGEHLVTQLMETDVEISAHFETTEYPLHNVLNWQIGTSLLLDTQPDNSILLSCDEYPLFWGKMGQKAGNISIKIETELPNKENVHGLDH